MAAGDAAALRDRAKTAFTDKNYGKAIRLYGELIDSAENEDPELHVYYSNRCACYQIQKAWNEALSDAQSCTSVKPAWTKGHSRLATSLAALGRKQEAARAWARAYELDPSAGIRQSYHSACRAAGMPIPDTGHDGGFGGGGGGFQFPAGFEGITSIKDVLHRVLAQLMVQYNMLSWETKIGIGVVIAAVSYYITMSIYHFFFTTFVYDDYDYDYDYGNGGFGAGRRSYSRGLSWPAWEQSWGQLIMPPMLPPTICPPSTLSPSSVWFYNLHVAPQDDDFEYGRRRRFYEVVEGVDTTRTSKLLLYLVVGVIISQSGFV